MGGKKDKDVRGKTGETFSKLMLSRMTAAGFEYPNTRFMPVRQVFDEFLAGRLDVFPEYQRGVVLDLEWAQELMMVLTYTAAPLNPVYIHANHDGTYEVADGAQRLTAIVMFLLGAFPIKDAAGNKVWAANRREPGRYDEVARLSPPQMADYLNCAPFSKTLAGFFRNAGGLAVDQPSKYSQLDRQLTDNVYGRILTVVIMPVRWGPDLSILYMVYTNMKMWKQTKDECLVHMHDRASRAMKAMEPRLRLALEACKIKVVAPTRQLYGAIVKVFACLDEFPHVPIDADEKLYDQMMMTMLDRYSECHPNPELLRRLQESISVLTDSVSKHHPYQGRAMTPDQLVAVLYVASVPRANVTGVLNVMKVLSAKNKADAHKLLRSWGVADAEGICAATRNVTSKGHRNLVVSCAACLRLYSCFDRTL